MNPAPETYEEMLRLFANLRGAMAERIHRDGWAPPDSSCCHAWPRPLAAAAS